MPPHLKRSEPEPRTEHIPNATEQIQPPTACAPSPSNVPPMNNLRAARLPRSRRKPDKSRARGCRLLPWVRTRSLVSGCERRMPRAAPAHLRAMHGARAPPCPPGLANAQGPLRRTCSRSEATMASSAAICAFADPSLSRLNKRPWRAPSPKRRCRPRSGAR